MRFAYCAPHALAIDQKSTSPRPFPRPSGGARCALRAANTPFGSVWEHLIRDDEDFRRHIEYCYINPVKHGLVRRVRDWPHSSFHRDVRADLFPQDWAGDVAAEGSFGERV